MEIMQLKDLLKSHRKDKRTNPLIKALIVISYSHWEGFVKGASRIYWEYIKNKGTSCNKLNRKIVIPLVVQALYNKSTQEKIHLLTDINNDPGYKLAIDKDKLVDTESNLKFEVLTKIIENFGEDSKEFETKSMFIDTIMLKHRNKFAHGDYDSEATYDVAIEIAETVINLIDMYKTKIENMIAQEKYKPSPYPDKG